MGIKMVVSSPHPARVGRSLQHRLYLGRVEPSHLSLHPTYDDPTCSYLPVPCGLKFSSPHPNSFPPWSWQLLLATENRLKGQELEESISQAE